jgi:CPA1 family monovalent cation:H+ antiporter
MGAAAISRWQGRPRPGGGLGLTDTVALSPRAAAVVAWCGMRGTVTLATALALPTGEEGGAPFPYRDLILFTAFAVVLVTLVLQGVTLRPLMARLRLRDDGSVQREARLARIETLRAALSAVIACPGSEATALVRQRYEFLLRRAEEDHAGAAADGQPGRDEGWRASSADADVVRAAALAERQRLIALRADGTIGDVAFQQVEQELDWGELNLQPLLRAQQAE